MKQTGNTLWTRSFLSVFLASFLAFIAFYLLLPTLPLFIINNLKAGTGMAGLILSVYTIAALLVRPFIGYYIDLYGRKWFYLAAMLGFALTFSAYPIVHTVTALILLRIFHGTFWGVTTAGGNTIAVDLVPPHRRGEGLGYFGLSSTIPMALGPLIGLQLVANNNFNRLFISSFVLALIGFFFATLIRYPVVPSHKVSFSLKGLIEKTSIPIALVLFLSMISYGGLVTFVSVYVQETKVGSAGFFFLIYASGITLVRLLAGRIFDKEGPLWITIISLLMISLGFLALSLWQTTVGFYGAAFAMGIGNGLLFPTFQAMANNMIRPDRRGAANSTLFTGLDLGIGTGMILTGLLSGMIGLSSAYFLYSILNLAALVLFLTFSIKHYTRNSVIYTGSR